MPSTKKRINLTVPDAVYEELQEYKAERGITNDAGACLQLIVQQLRSAKAGKALERLILNTPDEELAQLSLGGNQLLKEALKRRNND